MRLAGDFANLYGLDMVTVLPGSLLGKTSGPKTTTSHGLVKKILKGLPVLNNLIQKRILNSRWAK